MTAPLVPVAAPLVPATHPATHLAPATHLTPAAPAAPLVPVAAPLVPATHLALVAPQAQTVALVHHPIKLNLFPLIVKHI